MPTTFFLGATIALTPACNRSTPPEPVPETSRPVPSALATPSNAPAAPSSSAPPAAPPCPRRAGPTKLAWTNQAYKLVFDDDALRCLSDAERAAAAYVSTTLGTECDWISGTDITAPKHMNCKLTTALGLGHQCEDKHKSFLVDWLGDEIPDRCAKIPITAFAQSVLTEISLKNEPPTITVDYKATSTTGPGGEAWTWSETIVFAEKKPHGLHIQKRTPVGKR